MPPDPTGTRHNGELCEKSPLFLFFFFYEAVKYEQGVSAAEKHVLVLIFLSCVIPSSKRINHERVTSRNDEDL